MEDKSPNIQIEKAVAGPALKCDQYWCQRFIEIGTQIVIKTVWNKETDEEKQLIFCSEKCEEQDRKNYRRSLHKH
jgi:hypothetical protein